MAKEIILLGDDDYEYNIDEIAMVTIENNFGQRFMFKPNEIKSIKIIEISPQSGDEVTKEDV